MMMSVGLFILLEPGNDLNGIPVSLLSYMINEPPVSFVNGSL
jgi:hypothetical protein